MAATQGADGWVVADDPRDAAIRQMPGGLFEMRFERQIARPPEKVWAALTTPERLADWFGEALEIDLRIGGKYLVRFPGHDDDLVEGVIVACEAPRVLAFEWFSSHGNTVVRWELTPRDGGCRLVFHETGIDAWWFLGRAAGWGGFVDDLVAVACGGKPGDEAPGHHPREVERYKALYGTFTPGFDERPLGHHEAPGFVTAAGGGRYNIRYVRRWRLPLEKVWAAITQPERLADWLAMAKIDLRVGGGVELKWPTSDAVACYTIRELDPPRAMIWASTDPENPRSELSWRLYQEHPDIGVRLVLTETLLPPKDLLSIASGWDVHLHELPEAAGRDTPLRWSAERERARAARELAQIAPLYRNRLARDAPDAVSGGVGMEGVSSAHPDGEIRRAGDSYEIVFVRRLRKPIEKVWAALTVPERIADWFTDMRFIPDLRLGARVELRFDEPPYEFTQGEVVAFDPPRLFAWSWPDDEHPHSVVRCELVPDGDGCILAFSQGPMGTTHLTGTASGWHAFLGGLEAATEGVRTPGVMERELAVRAAYEAQLAALD